MIVAFSTSSPVTSVALFAEDGALLWEAEEVAPGKASEACVTLLEDGLARVGKALSDASLFVADIGPGSFTGVRVGIVLAKTCAWNFGVKVAGIDAFDLIDPVGPVAIPAQKGVFFFRMPGSEPIRVEELPEETKRYDSFGNGDFPHASGALVKKELLVHLDPMELMPKYLAEPSISTPKRPLSRISV